MLKKNLKILIISTLITSYVFTSNITAFAKSVKNLPELTSISENYATTNNLDNTITETEYQNLKILIDNFTKTNPTFSSKLDSITDELIKYYFNNENLYTLTQQNLYRDFINFIISNKSTTYEQDVSVLEDQAKVYCEKENFKNYGIQGKPINWNSLERDYDWYIDQGSTGAYNNINCVPTSALMAIKYFDKNIELTVSDIRQKSGKTGYMSSEDIENTLKEYGYSYDYIGFDLDDSNSIKTWIKRIINSGQVGIMFINTGKIPMQSNNSKVGKFYSGSYNHAIVLKGYIETDKEFYVDIYDPYSMGMKDTNNTFKGKNVYYTADSLRKACILEITGDESYKNNIGKTFGGIMYVDKDN